MNNKRKAYYNFGKIKKILNSESNNYYINGFYFPHKAVQLLEKNGARFFINHYMNMTIDDVLLIVKNNQNLRNAKKELFNEYDYEYAEAYYNNLLFRLAQC